MNALRGGWMGRAGILAILGVFLASCVTPRIDWNSRIGNYTYDQAILDNGPPDKSAKLADGTVVAEWLLYRGRTYVSPAFGYPYYYPWHYGAYHESSSPDYFLRLTFGPDGQLRAWKRFYK
jgi:hypothetical protein